MKVIIKRWNAVAQWRWDTRIPPNAHLKGSEGNGMILNDEPTVNEAEEEEDDVCGICRVAFEACCPACKTPGDDCPLSPSFFFFSLRLDIKL
jgi:anaphase-promoting complex subunit 11